MTPPHSDDQFLDADELPTNLTRWVSQRTLVSLVLDAVQIIDDRALSPRSPTRPELAPRMMLTLATYCYATAVYGSHDIEWSAVHDSMVRYICAHTRPDWRSIRQFRRQHRDIISRCLVHILQEAWTMRRDHTAVCSFQAWDEAAARDRIETSAISRLEAAGIVDRLALDI